MRTFQWDRRDTIDAAGSTAVAERHNDASLALFAQLLQEPGNLIFSPLSIRAALGIVVEGARGETAVQMRTALRWPAAGTEEHVAFAKLIQRLNASGGRAYEMAVANSLWVQEGMALQPAFLELIATYHAGELHPIDFRREAASAYVEINRWVANKTKRRILELVPPGCLSADTDLVLANAVHFKGRWDLPFKRSATRREPFHVCGGGEVRAHLMHRKEECPYRRGRGFQAVDLRYVGGDLSML
ncbi:MAG: hypothetical protein OEW77_02215, partial [Gemmatimonadota bacterium]|nr:hypothetical protein [Gemmatimonadota bacterium]